MEKCFRSKLVQSSVTTIHLDRSYPMRRRYFWLWLICFAGMAGSTFAGNVSAFWFAFAGYLCLSCSALLRSLRPSR